MLAALVPKKTTYKTSNSYGCFVVVVAPPVGNYLVCSFSMWFLYTKFCKVWTLHSRNISQYWEHLNCFLINKKKVFTNKISSGWDNKPRKTLGKVSFSKGKKKKVSF